MHFQERRKGWKFLLGRCEEYAKAPKSIEVVRQTRSQSTGAG
jgi:hypothetical protein